MTEDLRAAAQLVADADYDEFLVRGRACGEPSADPNYELIDKARMLARHILEPQS